MVTVTSRLVSPFKRIPQIPIQYRVSGGIIPMFHRSANLCEILCLDYHALSEAEAGKLKIYMNSSYSTV